MQTQHDVLEPKKVMTFKSRVVRYFSRCDGPYSTLREMQRHLKGSNKASIKGKKKYLLIVYEKVKELTEISILGVKQKPNEIFK